MEFVIFTSPFSQLQENNNKNGSYDRKSNNKMYSLTQRIC